MLNLLYNIFLRFFKNLFLLLYTNIYIYTKHKRNSRKIWEYHLSVSLSIMYSSWICLTGAFIYLFGEGSALRLIASAKQLFTHLQNTGRTVFCGIFFGIFLKKFFETQTRKVKNEKKEDLLELRKSYGGRYIKTKVRQNIDTEKSLFFFIEVYYIYFKKTFITLFVAGSILFVLINSLNINFIRQVALWFVVGNLFFWLFSGFNYFLKRYIYGKFTSAINRFWKRANMCFWLVEGFLFLLFYYYYLNSSQEPTFMYDYSSLNNDHLISLITAFDSLIYLLLMFFLLVILLLKISNITFYQIIFCIIGLSWIMYYYLYAETYQFYYVINMFLEFIWGLDDDYFDFKVASEAPKIRSKGFYFSLCLLAKFWHFLFIFVGWIFFLVKSYELKFFSLTLLSYNMQNIIILISLNLLTYSQWLKWSLRRYFDVPYYWFFTTFDLKSFSTILTSIWLLLSNLFTFSIYNFKYFTFNITLPSFFFLFSSDIILFNFI